MANYFPGAGIQDCRQVDEACPDADVGDISNPHLIYPVDNHPFEEIGVFGEAVLAIRGFHPLPLNPT